jgi:DNA-binding MarR family transcriptional regulator
MELSSDECARQLIEIIPAVMRIIRNEMQVQRSPDLTVVQFRALRLISRRSDTSLSEVAVHLGLTLPSTSKMIDGLVNRELVTRRSSETDRRCIVLEVTEKGDGLLKTAANRTQKRLSEMLAVINHEDLAIILKSMQILQQSLNISIS